MAHSVSARKRIRQNETHRATNKTKKSAFRTEIKKVLEAAEAGKVDAAMKNLPNAMKRIDKAAKTRAIHPNAAARYKSRLARAIARAGKKPAAKA
jgi:small subunit ribosomal protein S20